VGDYARVKLMDEGPGIPEDKLAQSVAQAHEGFLDIVDTPGWSTTFRVFIPVGGCHGVDSVAPPSHAGCSKNAPDGCTRTTSVESTMFPVGGSWEWGPRSTRCQQWSTTHIDPVGRGNERD
jgi:hypothetical protein